MYVENTKTKSSGFINAVRSGKSYEFISNYKLTAQYSSNHCNIVIIYSIIL